MFQADAAAYEAAQRLRKFVEAMRERAAAVVDSPEWNAANEWVAWCARHVDQVIDPLG